MLNTTQKISNAMNIKSAIQKENVFIPMKDLRESEDELFEKIEALKVSIEVQKQTLNNWNDDALYSKKAYELETLNDIEKLKKLIASYERLCDEMKKSIKVRKI